MEKEFIPYNEALALKKLGFDKTCLGWYNNEHSALSVGESWRRGQKSITTPLYQQAFRWFREKYGLVHCIEPHFSSGFNIYIKDIKNDKPYLVVYKTYEEAELECLKKLIEIAQK